MTGDRITGIYYMTRSDGVQLFRFAAPNIKNEKTGEWRPPKFKIRQDQTDTLYDEAIDVENAPYTYTETDIPIEGEGASETEQKAAAFDYLTGRSGGDE